MVKVVNLYSTSWRRTQVRQIINHQKLQKRTHGKRFH